MYQKHFPKSILLTLLIVASSICLEADDTPKFSCCADLPRPDAHAPIGVMGDHAHDANEWMVSYRFMHMSMEGNRDGTDQLGTGQILVPVMGNGNTGSFFVTPTEMSMEMHMLGIMYAPTDRLTLMAMLNYVDYEMDHLVANGTTFTTRSEGLGDSPLSLIFKAWQNEHASVLLNFGVSLPTGDIDRTDLMPLGVSRLPYPMQLGSGTFDLLPGITGLWNHNDWSGGGQLKATLRMGENDEDYTLGDRFMATTWVARELTNNLSASARIVWEAWDDIDRADPNIAIVNPMGVPLVPTAYPNLRSGNRIDLLFGLNFVTGLGPGENQRIALEAGFPILQDLDGPQLETDLTITLGWQMAL